MDDPTKPDLRISYLEHRAMRADAARLTELAGAAQPTDPGPLHPLATWYGHYEGAIHHHHHAEETVSYPALLERDPSFAEADSQLKGQHHVLADPLQITRESLGGLIGATGGSRWEPEQAEAVKAATALKAIVDTHTSNKEAIAWPRSSAHFTAAEYTSLNKATFKLVGLRWFVFAGPRVLHHATPNERAELLDKQPLLLRVIYRLALQPRYQQLVNPLGPAGQPARPQNEGTHAPTALAHQNPARPRPQLPRDGLTAAAALAPHHPPVPTPHHLGGPPARTHPGLVGYPLLAQPIKGTFWTLSAWTDQQHLDTLAKAMPHPAIIGKLRPPMSPTRFSLWTIKGSALPIT